MWISHLWNWLNIITILKTFYPLEFWLRTAEFKWDLQLCSICSFQRYSSSMLPIAVFSQQYHGLLWWKSHSCWFGHVGSAQGYQHKSYTSHLSSRDPQHWVRVLPIVWWLSVRKIVQCRDRIKVNPNSRLSKLSQEHSLRFLPLMWRWLWAPLLHC